MRLKKIKQNVESGAGAALGSMPLRVQAVRQTPLDALPEGTPATSTLITPAQ
jgi:hypothetical protein